MKDLKAIKFTKDKISLTYWKSMNIPTLIKNK